MSFARKIRGLFTNEKTKAKVEDFDSAMLEACNPNEILTPEKAMLILDEIQHDLWNQQQTLLDKNPPQEPVHKEGYTNLDAAANSYFPEPNVYLANQIERDMELGEAYLQRQLKKYDSLFGQETVERTLQYIVDEAEELAQELVQ